ncbi:MAG: DUF4382 domain-containing protein [Gemmatimonadota bacterium]|nr:DUF4382 domain-containing protein [Gemmatimonadota bacterium]
MARRWLSLVLVVAVPLPGCYREVAGPVSGAGLTRVVLTDAPLSSGSIERVEVYVAAVAASTTEDGTAGDWITIATPERRFDFAALQQGRTALAGSGVLPAGTYRAVRMTVRGDSSTVVYADGSQARVRWPAPDPFTIRASVAAPVAIPPAGSVIVLDLDVTRSFTAAFEPLFDLTFIPQLRAVDAAVTGGLAGSVFGATAGGAPRPVAFATIRALRGRAPDPGALRVTGRTDATGGYLVGFLPSGVYTVEIAAPPGAGLGPITVPDVLIAAGAESRLQVILPRLVGANGAPPTFTLTQGPPHGPHPR